MAASDHIAVIGGGISGLASAYRLQQLGVPVTLFEADDRVGGLIGTVETDGFLFESGPQSFQGTELILNLVHDLGIADQFCTAPPWAPRFILRRGKLQKAPVSPQSVITTPLLSAGSRWRVISEPLRRSQPPREEESVANFVRRKFGQEILEYLVSPFISGIYAGDPEKLSLRAAFPTLDQWEREYGGVLRGAFKSRSANGKHKAPSVCSFRRGVSSLPRALGDRLAAHVKLRAKVCAIGKISSDTAYEVHTQCDGRTETHPVRGVVLAIPAYTAAGLLGSISEQIREILSGIAYAGVAVAGAGYYARQMAPGVNGFGFLIPRGEKLRTLGTVWNSSIFPGRAPHGAVAMTSFAGGVTDAGLLEQPDTEIAAIVQRENAQVLRITGGPIASALWKHPKAVPQYNLGHAHIVAALGEFERRSPGIFFAGNYLEGPSLGKCVEHGFKTAETVRDFLAVRGAP